LDLLQALYGFLAVLAEAFFAQEVIYGGLKGVGQLQVFPFN
jgi:hypothetical protein